ncbi:hypothetical protein [Paenibacillus chungangensis]|uniref:Uncharacterized protein n=1 Tax=Paenibacillus chungangensis TaxID=696535 RepID=A0ABW3HVR2_9BACL
MTKFVLPLGGEHDILRMKVDRHVGDLFGKADTLAPALDDALD